MVVYDLVPNFKVLVYLLSKFYFAWTQGTIVGTLYIGMFSTTVQFVKSTARRASYSTE